MNKFRVLNEQLWIIPEFTLPLRAPESRFIKRDYFGTPYVVFRSLIDAQTLLIDLGDILFGSIQQRGKDTYTIGLNCLNEWLTIDK